jgi:hypothetical protein
VAYDNDTTWPKLDVAAATLSNAADVQKNLRKNGKIDKSN